MVHGADNVLSISGVLCFAGADEGIWVHHKNKDNEVLRQYSWGCCIVDKAGPLPEEEEDQEEEEAEAEVEAQAEATRCRMKNCKGNPYRGTECRDTKS